MRFRRDRYSIESGLAKGRQFPPWFLDFPELMPGEELYMQAFWDLDTERQIADSSFGKIPWSKAMLYVTSYLQFEGVMIDGFWRIIQGLDRAFLEWQKEEHDRHVRNNAPKKKFSGPQSTRNTYQR